MTDFLQLLLLGTIWTLVSILCLQARKRGLSSVIFYFVGNVVSVTLCALTFLLPGMDMDDFTAPGKREVLCFFLASSLLNGSGQALTMYNLKQGGRVLAVAIPQMSFLFPFVYGLLSGNEQPDLMRMSGIAVIAAAVFASSCGTPRKDVPGQWNFRRLGLALTAGALIGSAKLCVVMSGYLHAATPLSQTTRVFFYMLTAAVFFGVLTWFDVKKNGPPPKGSLKLGVFWGFTATVSNLLLFHCVDIFTRRGQSGIVYAVASAVLLVLISIYTRFRLGEKLTLLQNFSLAGMIAGVFLVRLGG